MSWNVLKVEKDFIHYLIRINYSIFSGIFNIYITKENIKRLLNFWGYIYQSKQSSTSDFEFEISDNLFLYLTKINGYIHIKTLFHENTNKYLSLKYVIDQSYLPQLIYRITKIMDNNETLDIKRVYFVTNLKSNLPELQLKKILGNFNGIFWDYNFVKKIISRIFFSLLCGHKQNKTKNLTNTRNMFLLSS